MLPRSKFTDRIVKTTRNYREKKVRMETDKDTERHIGRQGDKDSYTRRDTHRERKR